MRATCPECGDELEPVHTPKGFVFPAHDIPSKRKGLSQTMCVGSRWLVEDEDLVA